MNDMTNLEQRTYRSLDYAYRAADFELPEDFTIVCPVDGCTSAVLISGWSSQLGIVHEFTDDEGGEHHHDPNSVGGYGYCGEGHHIDAVRHGQPCPHGECDFHIDQPFEIRWLPR